MKKFFLTAVIFMAASGPPQLTAQSLAPRPALPAEGKGMVFFYRPVNGLYENMKVGKVAVAGAFNGWDKAKNPMSLDAATGIWSGTARLEAGREYHYKLVLNDSLWITDPNAPAVTQDDWRNGIIVGVEQGKPYVSGFQPTRNQLLKKIMPISARLVSEKGIDAKSIALKVNGEPQAFTVRGDSLFSSLAETLPDREYIAELTFADTQGTASAKLLTNFILDRIEPKIETPEFYRTAVMYEVFVRKFFDTNGDGIGDLNGVTAKLDYIQSLGANVIWLMPINKAPSEHGYNVSDYLEVQPELGTKADFKRLLDEAHKRKMKVLMDLVINHSDSTHPYFADAYRNPASRYSDWFQFTAKDNSDWEHFGGSRYMPKINFFNKEAEDWVVSIALHWQAFGVDGFRCDAAKEPPHQFWKRLRKELKSRDKNFLLLGEIWDNANYMIPYFRDEFDMVFDYALFYPFAKMINDGDRLGFVKEIENIRQSFPKNAQLVRFLANHDNTRALSLFGGDTLRLIQALTLLWTLPGTPMIYYGDEIGMTGTRPPDENVRKRVEWKSITDKNEILAHHRNLARMRKASQVLQAEHSKETPSITFLETASPNVLAYLRTNSNGIPLLIVANISDKTDSSYGVKMPSLKTGKYKSRSVLNTKSKISASFNTDSIYKPAPVLTPRQTFVLELVPQKK